MTRQRTHVGDLRGATRLAADATRAVTDLVEEMHNAIGAGPAVLGRPLENATRRLTSPVYATIRTVSGLVGAGVDMALEQLASVLGESTPRPEHEAVLAAINGVLGDYLGATDNPLAIEMQFRRSGRPLAPERRALAEALPQVGGKLLVLVHGSCMNDLQWCRNGHDHGAALARDLGYTPIYLHYNSGLHISSNGKAMAALLEQLISAWPVVLEELVILGHSMGGLVSRSACHYAEAAGHDWRSRLHALVCLGSPHHGAPLERGGNWVESPPRRQPLQCSPGATGADPQRGRHRHAFRQRARRGLARPRPLRVRRRLPLAPSAAQRRAMLCGRGHDRTGARVEAAQRWPGSGRQRARSVCKPRAESRLPCRSPARLVRDEAPRSSRSTAGLRRTHVVARLVTPPACAVLSRRDSRDISCTCLSVRLISLDGIVGRPRALGGATGASIMMVRVVVVLGSLVLGACASHEGPAKPKPVEERTGPDLPPPEPEPENEPLARASIASVQMLEDCPEPVVERSRPAARPAAKRAAVPADADHGWSPPCTQSTMQIAFTNQGGPARVAIERITVLHSTKSRSLGRIEARSPQHWNDGSYLPWDEVIAPSADTKASYKLSVPDWSAVEREIGESSYGQMFVLEVELTIDGQRQTVRSPEFLREEPHVVVT